MELTIKCLKVDGSHFREVPLADGSAVDRGKCSWPLLQAEVNLVFDRIRNIYSEKMLMTVLSSYGSHGQRKWLKLAEVLMSNASFCDRRKFLWLEKVLIAE